METSGSSGRSSADQPDWDLDDDRLRRSGTVKWTYQGADVLPAWVAEMDVAMAPVIRSAVDDALDRGMVGYPPQDQVSGLGEATAAFLARRFGMDVDAAQVVSCGDVMTGVTLALELLCEQAPVAVPVPAYPPFLEVAQVTGRALFTVPCRGTALDVEAIDAALAAGARTVLLSAPHNPLGRVFDVAELTALRDVVLAHGARVISDEIHAPLVLDGARHTPYSAIEGTADHVTTVLSASKAWNLPGLKCAQLVPGNRADLDALRAAPLILNHGTSSLGIAASIAAYTDGEPWLDGVLTHLDRQRTRFGELLDAHLPDVSWTPMQATYLAWVDASGTGLDDPAAAALARGRVMVHPGGWFGVGYSQFVRVNLATSTERLERIVERLATAWPPGFARSAEIAAGG